MINLISKTPHSVMEQITRNEYQTHCGMLNTPDTDYDLNGVERWALDNGCYTAYRPEKILKMLEKWQGLTGCLFAVLPDIVGNHEQTKILARAWLGTYQRLGYPIAFVCQNGCTVSDIFYDSIDAVFIGGDTEYKESNYAMTISREAHKRGLWVHWGRVGGLARFERIQKHGWIDSFDSSGFCIYPPKIKKWLPYQQHRQLPLFEISA